MPEIIASDDTRFMQRALDLARQGVGLASPNPAVGAVLVVDGSIVGAASHQYDARDHAEIAAIRAAGSSARGSTLYVTLEPCCHTGRTGPCTDAIIAAGIRRVVAAMKDPNPAVAGRGFEMLRAAGIAVEVGALEAEAKKLNEAFACWITTGKPFVTLKSALTLDGQLALAQAAKKSGQRSSFDWITSEESRAEVHRMRHAADALLTGIGAALADDPLLTDRSGLPRRRRLLRVILDSRLRLPLGSNLVKTAENDLLVVTALPAKHPRTRRLERAGVEVLRVAPRGGRPGLRAVLRELGQRDILSVFLEAGSTLNGAALAAGIVDKLVLFYAPKFAANIDLPFARAKKLSIPPLSGVTFHRFGPDFAVEGYLHDVYRNH
ncbi:MAG: bifunctional diaminohydroxyphosphoribosylaminopyrimidine deaminase/5-amino-6-(5-phosphoribosylamino)uracil reductase RibD [Candidatus Acidiferrales bacterium]